MPQFSIIIPTRDRADLFARALDSVLAQDFDSFEVIVINDGSSGAQLDAYRAIEASDDARVRHHHLPHRRRGHGPAYSRNVGAELSRGDFLCFLDDDDLWIDDGHLRRCQASIERHQGAVDLYFTDQRAIFADGREHGGRLWISGVERVAAETPDALGNRRVSRAELLSMPSFAHLNCTVFRRSLFESIGGMDETLRYENDRDVFLRAIDVAAVMLYNPSVIAQHHIPDASRADNVSTAVSMLEKKAIQLRIFDKAMIAARSPEIRAYARRAKGYELKNIGLALERIGRGRDALYYMAESLPVSFSLRWFGYVLLSALRVAVKGGRE